MIRRGIAALLRKPLYWLLLAIPAAIVLDVLETPALWGLAASAVAMVPLAGMVGEATESLAAQTGPRLGGLLNATLGNAAELIITIVAIREGLLELVKASITGSILGNLLFVLGASMLAGGLRNGIQSFDRKKALSDGILLVLAVTALAIPSLFSQTQGGIVEALQVEILSLGVAALMMVLYVLGLVMSLRDQGSLLSRPSAEPIVHAKAWPLSVSIAVLTAATVGLVWMSEILVSRVQPVVAELGISEFFLGVILVPIVGNVAEHLVAVTVAHKNQMGLSFEIAVGSSMQIALFVAPALVFLSLLLGNPLTLVFNSFELIALVGGVMIAALASADGESNWLEGAELVALYLMLALAFFFLPS